MWRARARDPPAYRGGAAPREMPAACSARDECAQWRRARDEVARAAVCRINAYTESVDVLEPYKDRDANKGVGTGFVIHLEGRPYVATAFHVIDEEVRLQVVFPQRFDGRPVTARVCGGNPHLDVALLELELQESGAAAALEESFELGDSDAVRPLDAVSAIGFALGAKHLQTSKGVVSGRKAIPNRLQCDVAVNPGNSGGPLITDDGSVVGIITSGMRGAQGIYYAAPITEALSVFRRVAAAKARPHYEMGVDFNAHFVQMNDALIGAMGTCVSGVFVSHTNPLPLARDEAAQLRPGDVLCKIHLDGAEYPIDMQMRIDAPWCANKIEFHSVLDRLPLHRDATTGVDRSGPIEFDVLRDGAVTRVQAVLGPPRHVLREVYPYVEALRFVSRGGAVVQLLNENVSNKSHLFKRCRFMDAPSIDMHSVPVITHLAPASPFSHDDMIGQFDYPVAINNVVLAELAAEEGCDELEAYARAWERVRDAAVVTLRMRDGTMASATWEDIRQYERDCPAKAVSAEGVVSRCTFADGCQGVRAAPDATTSLG